MNKYYWWCFGLACFSFLLRTTGAVLVVSILIYLLSCHYYKKTLLLLGLFLPTVLLNQLVVGSGHYLRDFMARNPYDLSAGTFGASELVQRISANFTIYTNVIAQTVVPLSSYYNLSAILGVILIFIMWRGAR